MQKINNEYFLQTQNLDHVSSKHTNDNRDPYQIFRNYSYKSKLHSQNTQVDYIWGRSIITQF